MFYVYAYLRNDHSPYYIGKGKGNRAYAKTHRIQLPKDKSLIKLIARNLLEHESFLLERKLILYYGRKDLGTGILRNLTNGGEGASGHVFTDDAKLKISKANKGKYGNRTGMKNSEEHKKKISLALKGREMPSLKGKPRTQEVKDKIASTNKGKKRSEFTKLMLSLSHKGLKKSDIHKQRIGDAFRGKKLSDEHKKKISETKKLKNELKRSK